LLATSQQVNAKGHQVWPESTAVGIAWMKFLGANCHASLSIGTLFRFSGPIGALKTCGRVVPRNTKRGGSVRLLGPTYMKEV